MSDPRPERTFPDSAFIISGDFRFNFDNVTQVITHTIEAALENNAPDDLIGDLLKVNARITAIVAKHKDWALDLGDRARAEHEAILAWHKRNPEVHKRETLAHIKAMANPIAVVDPDRAQQEEK